MCVCVSQNQVPFPLPSPRPSGNLVASTQRSPKAHEVVFFERNGLQHGGFPLRSGRMGRVVREMQWSSGSDILALWLDQLPPEVGGTATADGETDQSGIPRYLSLPVSMTTASMIDSPIIIYAL